MESRSHQIQLPFGTKTSSELAGLLGRLGLELCHIGWRQGKNRGVLTLTIDRPGGVSMDACAEASLAADAFLETVEELSSPYLLEVMSPGLDRQLYSVADAVRFRGSRIRVRLERPVDGAANFKGILESVEGDLMTLLDEDQGRRTTFSFGDVRIARLVPIFDEPAMGDDAGLPSGKKNQKQTKVAQVPKGARSSSEQS
jgi:ribosome maturation factor RimP